MFSKIVIICMGLSAAWCYPVERNDECERFIEASWVGHCGIKDAVSISFTNTDRKNLADKIKRIYDHTLEYGTGDLEEYHKWRSQFEFLPTIADANAENLEKDYHQHLQIFAATFQFLQKVQYRYHTYKFSQPLSALEQQALRVLCAMEENPSTEWTANRIDVEKMNEQMCKFNLGHTNKENQNFRNYRFTQMLFRQYLDELHQKIVSFEV